MITRLLLADGIFADLPEYLIKSGADSTGRPYLKFRLPEGKFPIEKLDVAFLKEHFSAYAIEQHDHKETVWGPDERRTARRVVDREYELTLFK